jgi:hypothetical protein
MQAPGRDAVVNKKPAASSTAKVETHSAARLERLSRQIGAPVNDEAVDRILATIDLAGTTVLLPGIDAKMLGPSTTAEIKRYRWGGSMRSMLSFLGAIVHLRKLSTQEARKKISKLAKAFAQTGDQEVALALAKMALEQSQAETIDASTWTNERIAGEFLPQQYYLFGKTPTMTRGGEAVTFIRAVLRELQIPLSQETIIRYWQDADKPKRPR